MNWTDLKFDVRIYEGKIQAYLAARPFIRIEGEEGRLIHEFFNDAQAAVTDCELRVTAMKQRNPDMTDEQARDAALLKWWNELQGNLAPSMSRRQFVESQISP